jgi:DNA-binding MarR family transcriptional regulator
VQSKLPARAKAIPEGGVTRIHAGIAALQRLSDVFTLRREQLAAEVELTDHQWSVLEEIATLHFMPSMFAKRRSSSPAAISKTLRNLMERGLVSVAVGDGDGRRRTYSLTADGEKTMVLLRKGRQRAIDHIWSDLDANGLAQFCKFSDELARRMEDYAGANGRTEKQTTR